MPKQVCNQIFQDGPSPAAEKSTSISRSQGKVGRRRAPQACPPGRRARAAARPSAPARAARRCRCAGWGAGGPRVRLPSHPVRRQRPRRAGRHSAAGAGRRCWRRQAPRTGRRRLLGRQVVISTRQLACTRAPLMPRHLSWQACQCHSAQSTTIWGRPRCPSPLHGASPRGTTDLAKTI